MSPPIALLDTHAWYWLLTGTPKIPKPAIQLIETVDHLVVCSISIFEISRKAGLGKWPRVDEEGLRQLKAASRRFGIETVSASSDALINAGFLKWEHRDPWDRLIAAVALDMPASLVSADQAFDQVPRLNRQWSDRT